MSLKQKEIFIDYGVLDLVSYLEDDLGNYYISVLVDKKDEFNDFTYLITRISKEKLNEYRDNKIDLLNLIKSGSLWSTYIGTEELLETYNRFEDIPNIYLPEENSYLN